MCIFYSPPQVQGKYLKDVHDTSSCIQRFLTVVYQPSRYNIKAEFNTTCCVSVNQSNTSIQIYVLFPLANYVIWGFICLIYVVKQYFYCDFIFYSPMILYEVTYYWLDCGQAISLFYFLFYIFYYYFIFIYLIVASSGVRAYFSDIGPV